jgi:hypothetical protein
MKEIRIVLKVEKTFHEIKHAGFFNVCMPMLRISNSPCSNKISLNCNELL